MVPKMAQIHRLRLCVLRPRSRPFFGTLRPKYIPVYTVPNTQYVTIMWSLYSWSDPKLRTSFAIQGSTGPLDTYWGQDAYIVVSFLIYLLSGTPKPYSKSFPTLVVPAWAMQSECWGITKGVALVGTCTFAQRRMQGFSSSWFRAFGF